MNDDLIITYLDICTRDVVPDECKCLYDIVSKNIGSGRLPFYVFITAVGYEYKNLFVRTACETELEEF